jgi:alkylation response protein AidB-like acyl-CoA dehydrogenase
MTGSNLFGNETCKGIDDFLRPHHLISPEGKMFCETLRKFVDSEILPHDDEFDDFWDWTERGEETFVNDIWKKLLIDVGLQKTFMPPEFGGTGGGTTVESCATVEEVARGDFSVACSGFSRRGGRIPEEHSSDICAC